RIGLPCPHADRFRRNRRWPTSHLFFSQQQPAGQKPGSPRSLGWLMLGNAARVRRKERSRKAMSTSTDAKPVITEKIVTVFGSSRPRSDDPDYAEAFELGKALAQNGFAVCSGGYAGVMEAVSRGAKEAGGKTYGVTAEFFKSKTNQWI